MSLRLLPLLSATFIAGQALATADLSQLKRNIKDLDLELSTSYSDQNSKFDKFSKQRTSIGIVGNLSLIDNLSLKFKGGQKFENGNNKSVFNERRNTAKSGLYYKYAYLSSSFFNLVSIKAGALDNTDPKASSMLLNNGSSFTGVREVFHYRARNFFLNLNATQALAQNDELSSKLDVSKDENTKFFSEYINIGLKHKNLSLGLGAGHFAYSRLSSSTAFNDAYYGNSVILNTETNSSYLYSYRGINLNAYLSLTFGQTSISAFGEYIKNDDAPEGKNKGQLAGAGLRSTLNDLTYEVKYVNFNNESDTAVSFYRNSNYKNNYKGNEISLQLKNKDGFYVKGSYVDRKVIDTNIALANETFASIELGKKYDLF